MNGYYTHKKYKYIKQISIDEKKSIMSWTLKQCEKSAVAMDISKSKIFYVNFYATLISIAATLLCCITKFFVVYTETLGIFVEV